MRELANPAVGEVLKGITVVDSKAMNTVKIYATYLPQFHEIPENNRWWGEGFTEWTNVRSAMPLFEGHRQPRVPADGYYNLTDPDIFSRQARLAKAHGIDAFCVYHYWFGSQMLLERPMEIVRNKPSIQFPFFFCWANQTWSRTWEDDETSILIKQEYPGKNNWLEHIRYLATFFSDERYEKNDGHPLLAIYSPSDIPRLEEMLDCWNEYLFGLGLKKIHLIAIMRSDLKKSVSALYDSRVKLEPFYSNRRIGVRAIAHRLLPASLKARAREVFRALKPGRPGIDYNFDECWNNILTDGLSKKDSPGAFGDWDNTARKGKSATIFHGYSPDKLQAYLSKLLRQAHRAGCSYVLFNAWNEWAEGAYLEPDADYGQSALEAVKAAVELAKEPPA